MLQLSLEYLLPILPTAWMVAKSSSNISRGFRSGLIETIEKSVNFTTNSMKWPHVPGLGIDEYVRVQAYLVCQYSLHSTS